MVDGGAVTVEFGYGFSFKRRYKLSSRFTRLASWSLLFSKSEFKFADAQHRLLSQGFPNKATDIGVIDNIGHPVWAISWSTCRLSFLSNFEYSRSVCVDRSPELTSPDDQISLHWSSVNCGSFQLNFVRQTATRLVLVHRVLTESTSLLSLFSKSPKLCPKLCPIILIKSSQWFY